jgi:hypothetical protein
MLCWSEKNHYDQFLIQGDNQAIIYFLSGNFKLKSLSVFKHLEKAWGIRANYLPNILYEHIPRESNKLSDHAAGVASKSLLSKRNTESLSHHSENNNNKQDYAKIYLPLPLIELNPEVYQKLDNKSLRLVEACQQPHPCTLYLCSCSFPDKSTQLDKLGRFLKQMTLGVLPDEGTFRYFATYKPAPAELDGRVYATTITAQTLSKNFRHLLFHDHFEIAFVTKYVSVLECRLKGGGGPYTCWISWIVHSKQFEPRNETGQIVRFHFRVFPENTAFLYIIRAKDKSVMDLARL